MEQNKNYKRTSRTQSELTKQKISQALKGRPKTWNHCQHIARGMKAYWQNDANFPDDMEMQQSGRTTIQDFI